jgi:hypothetical protein
MSQLRLMSLPTLLDHCNRPTAARRIGLISCKQGLQQHEQEVRIIWNLEPFYPIIEEPLPALTPLARVNWPDE